MTLVIALLTFVLVVNCLFLMLLVLIQLPKKEAGAGLAFGGGATDALFGAGSGNALTKMTKYTAGTFLGLALVLAVLNSHRHEQENSGIQQHLSGSAAGAPVATQPPPPSGQSQPMPLNTAPAGAPADQSAPVLTPSTSAPVINIPAANNEPGAAAPAEPAPAPQE